MKELICEYCGKNLLDNVNKSNVVFYYRNNIEKVIVCCNIKCDEILQKKYNLYSKYNKLTDYTNPILYKIRLNQFIDEINGVGMSYTKDAIKSYTDVFIAMSEFVFRCATQEEESYVKLLGMLG